MAQSGASDEVRAKSGKIDMAYGGQQLKSTAALEL